MNEKTNFRIEAVSCLLKRDDFQSPSLTLAIRIANAARLLDLFKIQARSCKLTIEHKNIS